MSIQIGGGRIIVDGIDYTKQVKDLLTENNRLRLWIKALGNLADVGTDNRGWMALAALNGQPAPEE